jgi:hypothetical protein
MENLGNIQENITQNVNEFSKPDPNVSASQGTTNTDFYSSNGIIAKFAFLVLVIFVFMLLLRLGIWVLAYTLGPSNKVVVVDGMIDGNSSKNISQDPKSTSSKVITRSNNQTAGIEFTWSVWLRLDGFPSDAVGQAKSYLPIFVKGNNSYNSQGVASISNGPGVYFSSSNNMPNALHIMMDTVSNASATQSVPNTQVIDVPNIPIKKWFHLIIRCQNKYIDVYINGLVVYRTNLNNVPLQNYDNILVCGNGGFSGKLSDLTYYKRALSIVDINGIVSSGPNTKNAEPGEGNYGGYYLSNLWYRP